MIPPLASFLIGCLTPLEMRSYRDMPPCVVCGLKTRMCLSWTSPPPIGATPGLHCAPCGLVWPVDGTLSPEPDYIDPHAKRCDREIGDGWTGCLLPAGHLTPGHYRMPLKPILAIDTEDNR